MKPSTLFLLLTVSLVMLPQTSQGQRIASLTHFAAPGYPTRSYSATYYFEGVAIGAGLVGTTGVWFGWVVCQLSETTSGCTKPLVVFGLAGALLGGTTGALVGGLFPAPRPRPLRGNAPRAVLIGATAGALWGFGVFPHFCLNGCSREEVAFGVSNVAVGALAGLLVGH
jgi:hypothetical protein